MIGSIIGDIVGSIYEFDNSKAKDFPFFQEQQEYTDDSILTLATADWLLNGGRSGDYYLRYALENPCPMGSYGTGFVQWVHLAQRGLMRPYNSCGNGSAMRVGPVGWACFSEEEVLQKAKESAECTHNHPEGIKGAQAVALCIYLARKGCGKESVRKEVSARSGYSLDMAVDEIRARYSWEGLDGAGNGGTCQGSVSSVRSMPMILKMPSAMPCLSAGIQIPSLALPGASPNPCMASLRLSAAKRCAISPKGSKC